MRFADPAGHSAAQSMVAPPAHSAASRPASSAGKTGASPSASRASWAWSAGRSAATSAARTRIASLAVCMVNAISASSPAAGDACLSSQRASARALSRRLSAVLADSGTIRPATDGAQRRSTVSTCPARYSPITRWALVPLCPKAFSADSRRSPPLGRQSIAWRLIWNADPSSSISGLSRSKPGIAGSVRCRIDSRILIRPITPAPAAAWPRLALALPSTQYPCASVNRRNARINALASTGSPSRVPVPWAST